MTGIVVLNHSKHDGFEAIRFEAARLSSTTDMVKVEVLDADNRIYAFFMPVYEAEKIDEGQIVTISGCWLKRQQTDFVEVWDFWVLLTIQLKVLTPFKQDYEDIVCTRIKDSAKCYYCDSSLKDTIEWGLDTEYNLECKTCGETRKRSTPQEFKDACIKHKELLRAQRKTQSNKKDNNLL